MRTCAQNSRARWASSFSRGDSSRSMTQPFSRESRRRAGERQPRRSTRGAPPVWSRLLALGGVIRRREFPCPGFHEGDLAPVVIQHLVIVGPLEGGGLLDDPPVAIGVGPEP